MKNSPLRFVNLAAVIALTLCLYLPAAAQEYGKEVAFSPVGGIAVFPNVCWQVDSMVYGPNSLKHLLSYPECAKMFENSPDKSAAGPTIDLAKKTMVGWQIGGDCHMRARTNLYRDDKEKLFTVVLTSFYGGCRAGGWKQGIFTIEKIPSDYRVRFVRHGVDNLYGQANPVRIDIGDTWTAEGLKVEKDGTLTDPHAPKPVKPQLPVITIGTRAIDFDGCIQFRDKDRMIIRSDEEFKAAIRDDASREHCLKKTAGMNLDLNKNILYGITISTGYCGRPPGLKYSVTDDPNNRHYTFHVFYQVAGRNRCRAVTAYDLWVLAPKEPAGYYPTFDVIRAEADYKK